MKIQAIVALCALVNAQDMTKLQARQPNEVVRSSEPIVSTNVVLAGIAAFYSRSIYAFII